MLKDMSTKALLLVEFDEQFAPLKISPTVGGRSQIIIQLHCHIGQVKRQCEGKIIDHLFIIKNCKFQASSSILFILRNEEWFEYANCIIIFYAVGTFAFKQNPIGNSFHFISKRLDGRRRWAAAMTGRFQWFIKRHIFLTRIFLFRIRIEVRFSLILTTMYISHSCGEDQGLIFSSQPLTIMSRN